MPSLAAVPAQVQWLRARVAELEARNEAMAAQLAARDAELEAARARLAALADQIGELRRRLGKDSATSSKPPSSDNPSGRSRRTGRCVAARGAGQVSSWARRRRRCTSPITPDEMVECGPRACAACGADLADAAVTSMQKQVFEAAPAPPPKVTEYQVVAKRCSACGETTSGTAPAGGD